MRRREPKPTSISRESKPVGEDVAEPPGEQASFGHYLQRIRIEKQIRLEQVAEETRIGVAILEAVEHEDFARLPPDVFTIGFLRAYAKAVGADGSEAVRRYRVQRRGRQTSLEREEQPDAGRREGRRRMIAALALFAALIAAGLFAYQQWNRVEAPGGLALAPPAGDPPASLPAEPLADRPPSEAVKKPPIPAAPKHVLTIVAHENSWVKVVIDQGAASEHKLKAGEQLRLVAQNSFNLLIGNVGGVKMSLDNQPVTVPGKRGEVVNLHLP
jgi:cytoskeletal protein RodZ